MTTGPQSTTYSFLGADIAENVIVITYTEWHDLYLWSIFSFSDNVQGSGYQIVTNECGILTVQNNADPDCL